MYRSDGNYKRRAKWGRLLGREEARLLVGAPGVSPHRGPPAPKAENQRSPALMRADFDDSALTVGHLRWVCWHYD